MKKSPVSTALIKKESSRASIHKKIKSAASSLSTEPDKSLLIAVELLQQDANNPLLLLIAGRAKQRLGAFLEAEQYIEQALKQWPEYKEALYAKTDLLYKQERYEELEKFLVNLSETSSGEIDLRLQSVLTVILLKKKKYEQAEELLRKLIKIEPYNWLHWNNLGMVKLDQGMFDEMESFYLKSQKLIKDDSNLTPFFNMIVGSHYHPGRSAEQILSLCREWQECFKCKDIIETNINHNKTANKKLRIGMISDGFRSHPVGNMITLGLSKISKAQMEFYAYSTNFTEDQITKKIKALCAKWAVVADLSYKELATMIHHDEVDILFDLSGYNANSRVQTMQLRPAPIQIKWVGGLISSTGLDAMDYLLSDSIETPEGTDLLYTEKLIRLPDDYICYDPPQYLPPINTLPATDRGYVTFGCFNNASKINDELLEQWATILHAVPNSRLFLKSFNYSNSQLCERIFTMLEVHGINRARVTLEGASPHRELLSSYNSIDIALDPWPYSGGLTTCEAMAMGVPVITLPGPTFAGRHSASHLVNAGMPELVANSWDQYINIAVGIANDLESLSIIRQNLRDVLLASPVCDGKLFAKNFSDAMRAIWQRYCEGKSPEALTLKNNSLPYFHDNNLPVTLLNPVRENQSNLNFQDEFTFQLSGKIIVIDNGASIAKNEGFVNLVATDAFHFVLMDILGEIEERHLPLRKKAVQHIKLHALGDGRATPIYMCLDPRFSSGLEPLSLDEDTKVIAKVMAQTSRLDNIDGLEHLDWLILDNRYDIQKIFSHGNLVLTECLVIQIRLTFSMNYQGQLLFGNICEILAQYGLVFHMFKNVEYSDPITTDTGKVLFSSKMISAEAVYIPDETRLRSMTVAQCEKLAFIMHTIYGAHDLAYYILSLSSQSRANIYIASLNNVAQKRTKHSLPQRLIISLTSYSKRFKTLHLTLDRLVKQSVIPDRIILWIAESEQTLLPKEVLDFRDKGVEIKYCEDLKSYKKIVPTLVNDPNAFIVTADDDLNYQTDWLEKLIASWDGSYKTVVAWRAHKIICDENGMPIPYRKWHWQYNKANEISGLIMPTTGFGTLYPPHCFYYDVINKSLFENLSFNTDDIWLYWMCRLNGTSFKVVGDKIESLEWEGTGDSALWHDNLLLGKNDENIKKLISHYGFVAESDSVFLPEDKNLFSFSYLDKIVTMYLPNKLDHIQKIIKNTCGFYEKEMLEDIASRVSKDSMIIDIGANIGNHSVYFALFCNAKRVLSFEPQKEVYNTLSKNIILNSLSDKISAFEMGLGSRESTAKLGVVDEQNIGMTKLTTNVEGDINVSTLDAMMKDNMQETVSVIKIDVEGMEMDVLRGARKTIMTHNPVIYAEAATKLEFDEINAYLSDFGYAKTKRFNSTATYLFEKLNN